MKSTQRLSIALMVALLAVGVAAMGVAGEPDKEKKEVVLSGQLSMDSEGEYVLTDPDSGEGILLRGLEDKLAEHVGSSVEVKGSWDWQEGEIFFQVRSVEPVDA